MLKIEGGLISKVRGNSRFTFPTAEIGRLYEIGEFRVWTVPSDAFPWLREEVGKGFFITTFNATGKG